MKRAAAVIDQLVAPAEDQKQRGRGEREEIARRELFGQRARERERAGDGDEERPACD